jgi:hypothetical protein
MAGNPYVVVDAPSYQAPQVDFSKFMRPQQPQQPQKQGKSNPGLLGGLTQFLSGPALVPGSAVPGAWGPTSVGGVYGPTPLMQASVAPMFNTQGLGLY